MGLVCVYVLLTMGLVCIYVLLTNVISLCFCIVH